MGRQTLAFAQMGFYYMTIQQYGTEAITPELVAGVSGAASIYTLVKGKAEPCLKKPHVKRSLRKAVMRKVSLLEAITRLAPKVHVSEKRRKNKQSYWVC